MEGESDPDRDIRVPLSVEGLEVTRRKITTGHVSVSISTSSREVTIDETLTRDAVEVERVPIGRFVDEPPPVRSEGDVLVVPVLEEIVVKRLLLKEEIRVRRVRSARRHEDRVSLRSETASVARSGATEVNETAGAAGSRRSATMPSETIVAVYETEAAAEAAVSDLVGSGIPRSAVEHYGRETGGTFTEQRSSGSSGGFWNWLSGGETGSDARHADEYDRSIEGGRNVVTVIVDVAHSALAIAALERHSPLELDEHGDELAGEPGLERSPGVAPMPMPMSMPMGGDPVAEGGAGMMPGATAGGTMADASYGTRPVTGTTPTGTTVGEEPMETGRSGMGVTGLERAEMDRPGMEPAGVPGTAAGRDADQTMALAEEQLEVGKRSVERGMTRVRRYVVERPVEEQIRLRDERVSVFRRPVTGRADVAADAFTDRTIEMTETDEEAVVSKKAYVAEEIVIHKDVEERVETVRDTVRKEEAEITGPGRTETDRPT